MSKPGLYRASQLRSERLGDGQHKLPMKQNDKSTPVKPTVPSVLMMSTLSNRKTGFGSLNYESSRISRFFLLHERMYSSWSLWLKDGEGGGLVFAARSQSQPASTFGCTCSKSACGRRPGGRAQTVWQPLTKGCRGGGFSGFRAKKKETQKTPRVKGLRRGVIRGYGTEKTRRKWQPGNVAKR